MSIFLPKAENPNTGDLKLLPLQSSFPFTSNITLNNSVKQSSSSTITTNSSSMELQIYLLDFTPLFKLLLISRLMATFLIHFTELKSGRCREGSFDFEKPRMLRKGNMRITIFFLMIHPFMSQAMELSIHRPNCELIPKECFRFQKYERLMSLANTDTYLPESGVEPKGVVATNINPKLVGGKKQLPVTLGLLCYRNKVIAIKSTINGGTQRVILSLRLERISSSLILYSDVKVYGSEPKVVLVPSINPKVVGDNILIICNVSSIKTQLHPSQYITKKLTFPHAGRLFLNGTYGTHRYFDSETAL
ncbi:hypothetical protein HID58_032566 [Brassica napus]|uniref:Uncharacterized protein n=1 Tax=Brassica napus TaxID=3708 RepID=A0ABQ8BWT0_BRANA|nr:hypothetical protein HID58_032566 [Brassica napus]